jgi:hypothetical protein
MINIQYNTKISFIILNSCVTTIILLCLFIFHLASRKIFGTADFCLNPGSNFTQYILFFNALHFYSNWEILSHIGK